MDARRHTGRESLELIIIITAEEKTVGARERESRTS